MTNDRTPKITSITYEYTDPREVTVFISTVIETEVKMFADYSAYTHNGEIDGDDYEVALNFWDTLDSKDAERLFKSESAVQKEIDHEITHVEFS